MSSASSREVVKDQLNRIEYITKFYTHYSLVETILLFVFIGMLEQICNNERPGVLHVHYTYIGSKPF